MIRETSSVLPGRATRKGICPGASGCVDQAEPECDSKSDGFVSTLSTPMMSLISDQAACRFSSAVLCFGGLSAERGVVEVGGVGRGEVSVPM